MFDWLSRLFPTRPSAPPSAPGTDIELPRDLPHPSTAAVSPSDACIALIEREEGCGLVAYLDVDGVYVLGYGNKIFDGKPVVKGQTTDQAGADRNCRSHAQACATAARSVSKVPLTQGQLDALVDFVYNVGIGGLTQSTILKTLNARQPVTEEMFTRWNKITKNGQHVELPALTLRRQREYQLYIS